MVQNLNISFVIHKFAGCDLFPFIHSKEVSRILSFVIDPPSREEAELPQSNSRNIICACFYSSENFQLLPSAPCNSPDIPGEKPLMFQNCGSR